jgi:hypothetical protein
MIGQEQRVHTGWLTVDETGVVYAPHTKSGYALPPSKAVFVLGAAFGMRAGLRKARKLGLVGDAAPPPG